MTVIRFQNPASCGRGRRSGSGLRAAIASTTAQCSSVAVRERHKSAKTAGKVLGEMKAAAKGEVSRASTGTQATSRTAADAARSIANDQAKSVSVSPATTAPDPVAEIQRKQAEILERLTGYRSEAKDRRNKNINESQ